MIIQLVLCTELVPLGATHHNWDANTGLFLAPVRHGYWKQMEEHVELFLTSLVKPLLNLYVGKATYRCPEIQTDRWLIWGKFHFLLLCRSFRVVK